MRAENDARRPRRKFSEKFKRDAVEIVRSSDRSIAEVARELGIYDSSLGSWVRQDRVNRGEREGVSSDDKDRLLELDRENARLRMEWPASPSATWIEAWYNRRPPQFRPQIPITNRMGEPLPSQHRNPGRLTTVSGQRGELQAWRGEISNPNLGMCEGPLTLALRITVLLSSREAKRPLVCHRVRQYERPSGDRA